MSSVTLAKLANLSGFPHSNTGSSRVAVRVARFKTYTRLIIPHSKCIGNARVPAPARITFEPTTLFFFFSKEPMETSGSAFLEFGSM